MKKTLSWLIVLAMVFAMIPAVFAAEETTGSVTLTATELGLANGVPFESKDIDPITFSAAQGENPNNPPKYYSSDSSIRIYELNYLTITPDAGYEITSITVNCVSASYGLDGAACDLTNVASSSNTDTANAVLVPADGTQPVVILNNDNAANNNQLRILSITVDYAVSEGAEEEPEIPVEPETPVIPETPAGDLVLGDNVLTMEANANVLEQTYIATEAGTLTFEFTKLAYQGSLGMTDKSVAEAFAGANDTTPWFTVTIDGVGLAAKYKGAVEVEAGQTVTLKVEHTGNSYFLGKVREMTVNLALEAGSSEGGDVVEPIEGEIFNVETTDNNCYIDGYTFTAAVSGTYTFHIPAGLGLTTPERDENWQPAIIDYYDNANGYTHVIDLYAGQEYEILVGSTEKTQWEIIWTVEEKEVEAPSEPETPVEPPVAETDPILAGTTAGKVDTLYAYTATADGILKIDVTTGSSTAGALQGSYYNSGWLILEVDGVVVDGLQQGVHEVEVVAGQTVTIQVKAGWNILADAKPNFKLELAAPPAPALNEGEGTAEGDVEYVYVATANGTLTIDVSTGTLVWGSFGNQKFAGTFYSNNNLALVVNGVTIEASNKGVASIEVTEGDQITIKVSVLNADYTNVKANAKLTLEPAVEGGEEGGEEGGLIIGTNNIAGDVEYIYTATAEGTLTIDAVGGKVEVGSFGAQNVVAYYYQSNALQLIVNGEIVDGATYKGVTTVDLKAGDSVTIKIGYGNANYQNAEIVLTLSFEEGSVGGGDVVEPEQPDQPEQPEQPEVGSGSGTESDPIILSSENQTVEHAGGDLYYQWIAPADGTLKVTFNGGACLLSGSSVGSWETIDGGRMLEVAKGDKISINFWNGTAFTIAFEEASEEFNGILLEGNSVELKRGGPSLYAWTAPADGKFIVEIKSSTFSYGYTLTVNGQSMGYGTNELILDVKAGDLIIVEFTTNAGASTDWVMVLVGEMDDGTCRHEYENGVCIKCGEAKAPDGTQDYPFIIGNQNETYAYESTPAWFQFTAEADTTLTIKTNKTKWHMLANATIDGASISPTRVTDGNYYVYTIEVKAGSVLKFRVNATSSSADEMIVEVQQQVACQHGNTAERHENVQDATCTAGGSYDKVTYCTDCQEVISTENVTTDALEHNYVEGTCTGCGAADPNYVAPPVDEPSNPGTGSMNILAIALIAMMSATAVVVTAKKSDEE